MIDSAHIPPIADGELLARFIVNSNEVRADGTVRPQLFLPYKRDVVGYPRRKDEQLSLAAKLAAAIEGRWYSAPSGERQMTVYPHTSTQRKQVFLKTHSLAPRACMPIRADRLNNQLDIHSP